MNLYEVLFLLTLFILIGITLAKIYNLFNAGNYYSLSVGVLLFIAYSLFSFIALVVVLFNPETYFYSVMLKISIWGVSLNILFLIAEIIFTVKDFIVKPIEAHKPTHE